MEIITEETKTTHPKYETYTAYNITVKLDKDDILEIVRNGVKVREYVVKTDNCSFSLNLQDKGVKRFQTELENKIYMRDKLSEEITIEEAKVK